MKFTQRVMVSLAVPAALAAILGTVICLGTVGMDRQLGDYFAHEDSLAAATNEMYAQGLQMGQALRNTVLDPANKKAYENLENAIKGYDRAAEEARAAATPAQQEQLRAMGEARGKLAEAQDGVLKFVKAGDLPAATELLNKKETPTWRDLRGQLLEMKKATNAEKDAARTRAGAAMSTARGWVIVLVLAMIAVCIGFVFSLRGVMRRELGGDPALARDVLERVAAGDLLVEVPVQPGDGRSLMSALLRTRDSLRSLVADVNDAAGSIAMASGEIAAGNHDLSNRTESQASSLQETASSMAQLSSTVQQNAEAAQQATQLASAASSVAAQGGEAVNGVVQTMGAISAQSSKISDITSVIDGIAFQTNILALNAAVEAARAGEQGRGFAVVASEVRSLAQRSAQAAREIKQLVAENVEKVDSGTRQVQQAGQTMGSLVAEVQRVSGLIREISSATQEQSGGLQQVSQAVGQLDEVTQQNAALVEESTAAAQSLNNQAERLTALVRVFKVS